MVLQPKHGPWLNMAEIELSALGASAWVRGCRTVPRSPVRFGVAGGTQPQAPACRLALHDR